MKILNVAEKPSVAKEVTKILSKGAYNSVHSDSKFNPVYEFNFPLKGNSVNMIFTSVTGHLMKIEFLEEYSNWNQVNPSILLKGNIIFKNEI